MSSFKSLLNTQTAAGKTFNDFFYWSLSLQTRLDFVSDLTAAFDTVDHFILISQLQLCGTKGTKGGSGVLVPVSLQLKNSCWNTSACTAS